ncbi:MAG: hypothetical protein JWN02_1847 [Acidobacteria bacterium]|nr:hypothetical protein [Acidobacteriota bacterium]
MQERRSAGVFPPPHPGVPRPDAGRFDTAETLRTVVLLLLLLLAACHHEAPSKPAALQPAAAKPAAATTDFESETLPSRNAYAGSERCKECHEKNYLRWTHDWHARALGKAGEKEVAGDFRDRHFRGEASEAWFSRRGGEYLVRTRGRDGTLGDYPVQWLIGAKRMQDPVTVFDDGRWQVLPVYFHITSGGKQPHQWVDYNSAKQGRVEADHPYFWTNFQRTANKECIECHATGLDVRYERSTHRWSTSFVDAGVACEACHGPGGRHAETKAKGDIIHPGHLAKELQLAICARCHGPREPLFPLLDWRDQFRPGQRYDDRYQALVITDSTERSGEFFADGRPNSSSFEYQALLQSRCFLRGGATCLSCHTAPHQEHAANEIKKDANASCSGCHAALTSHAAAHSHHRAATCVDCHMPKLLSGVLDHFPDHTLDIPNPENTVRHDVPNACNLCHADRKPADMQRSVESWWPEARSKQGRRFRLAEAIDEKTAAGSFGALTEVVRDGSETPTLRGAAALLLGQRFPREAASVLLPLLGERDQLVRSRFVEGLGYAQAREAGDAVAGLGNDPSIHVRQMAALVLASFRDPRGIAALQRLADDPETRALSRPHIMLAIDAANHGDLGRAQRELEFVVAEVPYATDALVMLGDIHARQGDMAAAKALFEEALRFNPRQKNALARLQVLH